MSPQVFEQEAPRYFKAGANVLPIALGTKRPAAGVEWKEWQHRRQTSAELARLVDAHPAAEIALILGAVSGGLVDLECDGDDGRGALRELRLPLPPTASWESPRGPHRLYRARDAVRSSIGFRPHLDVLSEGRYVVAPSSAGRRWLSGGLEAVAPLPPEWGQVLRQHGTQHRARLTGLTLEAAEHLGAPEGTRNVTLAALVGRWLTACVPVLDLERRALAWAQRCSPPFPAEEALRVVESITRTRERTRSPERAALLLARANDLRQPARAVFIALVALWGELGLSEPMLFAADRIVADYAGLSIVGARAGLKALADAGLIRVSWGRDPGGRRTRVVELVGFAIPRSGGSA